MTDDLHKQSSLIRVLEITATSSAKGISYAIALLGLASLVPGLQLPPELAILASGLGVEAMGNLLEKVASKEKISDDEINKEVQKIVANGEINNLLTKDEFFHAFSHFLKKFRAIAKSQDDELGTLRAIGDTLKAIEEKIEEGVFETKLHNNIEQLIEILETRASFIIENLSVHYKYAKVQRYLKEFKTLHRQHINALQKGNLLHAHEILRQINELSTKLELNEFWQRHKIETPERKYKLNPYGFEYGFLISEYLSSTSPKRKIAYNENLFEREAFFDFQSKEWRRPQRPANIPYEFILSPRRSDGTKQQPMVDGWTVVKKESK